MKKDILLLAKSKKYNGYCVAGIDIDSGEWLRLKVRGRDSVPKLMFRYNNSNEPKLLDTICVDVVQEHVGEEYHPEDVLMSGAIEHKKVNNVSLLYDRVKADYEIHDTIYYNRSGCIMDEMVSRIPKEDRYSLIIVEPTVIKFYVLHTGKLCVTFSYKGKVYGDIRVTDERILAQFSRLKYGDEAVIYSRPCYFVISLGELFNGYHYKLLASVIEKEDIELLEFMQDMDFGNKK